MSTTKKIALFVGGTLFGSAGFKILGSKDAKKVYTQRIQRNYRFVMGFNGALIALGAFGLLAPATSALLHNSSTLLLSMDCLTNLLPE